MDNQVKVDIVASTAELASGLRQASTQITEFVEGIKSQFLLLAGLFGGGELFKGIIESTQKFYEENIQLSRSFGISIESASILRSEITLLGISTETYTSAALKLDRQIRTNETTLNRNGLVTRDNNGLLLNQTTLMQNAITWLGQYAEGNARNTAALTIFGRNIGNVNELLRMNSAALELAKKDNEELGLTMTEQEIENAEDFALAVQEVKQTFIGLAKAIGDVVIPTLTTLLNWFRDAGPFLTAWAQESLAAIRNLINGLVDVFRLMGDLTSMDLSKAKTDLMNLALSASGVGEGVSPAERHIPGPPKGAKTAEELIKDQAGKRFAAAQAKEGAISALGDLGALQSQNELALKLDQETNQKFLKQKLDIMQKVDAINIETALKQREVFTQGTLDWQNAQNKFLEIKQKAALQEEQINHEMILDAQKDYVKLGEEINTSLVDNFSKVISGTEGMAQAFKKFALSVIDDIAKIEAKNLIQAVFGPMTGSNQTGGGIGGFISGIVGGGNNILGIPSFDVGSWKVPGDTMAMVHKNEAIIPANMADNFRAGKMGGMTVNMNVNTPDAGSFRVNQGEMMATVANMARRSGRNL